jgi:hypothetical protein
VLFNDDGDDDDGDGGDGDGGDDDGGVEVEDEDEVEPSYFSNHTPFRGTEVDTVKLPSVTVPERRVNGADWRTYADMVRAPPAIVDPN